MLNSIDEFRQMCWSKQADQKYHTVSLDICQHTDSTTLVNFCLHHKFIPDRRYVKEKIFEDSELEALLAEDSCQMQEGLAESLGVTQQPIFKRLKAMGMIQKQGNRVPYELKPRDVELRFFSYEQLLQGQNRKEF